jgi:hypothetical protein
LGKRGPQGNAGAPGFAGRERAAEAKHVMNPIEI